MQFNYSMKKNNQDPLLKTTILEKDVGAYISNDLKWKSQVQAVVSKANSQLVRIISENLYF